MPLVLHLPRRSLVRKDAVRRLVSAFDVGRFGRAEVEAAFAFKDDELPFARALAERTQLWLFRVNQRAFAGDFVVVDVSSPTPGRRAVVAMDLKRGQRIREGRQGIQMGRTDRVAGVLASSGVIDACCTLTHVTGDARLLLADIGALLGRARARA